MKKISSQVGKRTIINYTEEENTVQRLQKFSPPYGEVQENEKLLFRRMIPAIYFPLLYDPANSKHRIKLEKSAVKCHRYLENISRINWTILLAMVIIFE